MSIIPQPALWPQAPPSRWATTEALSGATVLAA
nr:MAG TPA: hypothetical protein [Caudoviricetes sp.]